MVLVGSDNIGALVPPEDGAAEDGQPRIGTEPLPEGLADHSRELQVDGGKLGGFICEACLKGGHSCGEGGCDEGPSPAPSRKTWESVAATSGPGWTTWLPSGGPTIPSSTAPSPS